MAASTPQGETKRDLTSSVQYLKGCGPQRAEQFARLGVGTIRELLFFFPRDYQDMTELRSVSEFEPDTLLSVLGVVEDVDARDLPGGRSILGVLVKEGNHYLRAMWFNLPFMRKKFQQGMTVLLSGKAKLNGQRWEMVHPQVQFVDTEQGPPQTPLLPVYSLTEGLLQRHVRSLMEAALAAHADELDEVFPPAFLTEHDLWPIGEALRKLHFPATRDDLERARRRFVYQELLVLQLALAMERARQQSSATAMPLELSTKIDARIRRLLPFALTPGQDQAISEIASDMGRASPMNRLLQGDVGSGKTMVAVYAMLLAVAHGTQAALMAPTEILARQHAATLERLLKGSQVRIGLITGGLTGKARQDFLEGVAAGQFDIVVGTQALVEAETSFPKLGLVIIDEQHKFGVRQRALLKAAGLRPHYLVMTATPIPRSIGLTLYGDLDISSLRDAPPGRQPVKTYLPPPEDHARWWEFFRKKLREGRQGYVIAPLVEGSEEVQATSLETTFEALANGELEEFRLGIVHGRMTSTEKQAAMETFRAEQTQVLLATSVVEVGIDVPNATLMTVLSAERFGLAQLHQLRGRVSRGAHPGFCCLFADAQTPDSQQRLQALVESHDGFQLAEIDFAMRGPGDLLGTRQHGMPPLRIADLVRDRDVLLTAREDARKLVASDPELASPDLSLLRRMVLARYGRVLDLGDVG